MNNVPVPMDLDRARFNRNRGGNSTFRGRAANAGPGGQIRRAPNPSASAPCFKCGATDHWANKCPTKGGQFNLIDLDLEGSETDTMMSVDDIKERINAMSPQHQQKSTFLIPSYSILLHLIPLILGVRREKVGIRRVFFY